MVLSQLIQKKYKPTYKAMGWLMIQELIFSICGLVDITCANFISNDAVIAVAMAAAISTFMLKIRSVFSSALRVTSSRYFGAGDIDSMSSVLSSITILSVVLTAIISCVLGIFGKNLLGLFSLTPNQILLADAYIKARIPGILIFSITNPMVRSLEAQGKVSQITKLRLVNLLDIPFSLILLPFWGVTGIGLGTTITEAIEFLVVYFVFRPRYGKLKKKGFKETVILGLTYLPESLFNSMLNTMSLNLCIKYLSIGNAVIVQLVYKFYDTFIDLIYACTRHVDIALGRAYGTGYSDLVVSEFDKFKHCYSRIWLIHAILALFIGTIYFSFITKVENFGLAMILLLTAILADLIWSVTEPLTRVCGIYNTIKPVVITRVVCLIALQLPSQFVALKLGADVFSIPICYIVSDFIWFIVTYKLCRKLPIWCKCQENNRLSQMNSIQQGISKI